MKINDASLGEESDNSIGQESVKRILHHSSDSDDEVFFSTRKKKKLQILDDDDNSDTEVTTFHPSNVCSFVSEPVTEKDKIQDVDSPCIKLPHETVENGNLILLSHKKKIMFDDEDESDDDLPLASISHSGQSNNDALEFTQTVANCTQDMTQSLQNLGDSSKLANGKSKRIYKKKNAAVHDNDDLPISKLISPSSRNSMKPRKPRKKKAIDMDDIPLSNLANLQETKVKPKKMHNKKHNKKHEIMSQEPECSAAEFNTDNTGNCASAEPMSFASDIFDAEDSQDAELTNNFQSEAGTTNVLRTKAEMPKKLQKKKQNAKAGLSEPKKTKRAKILQVATEPKDKVDEDFSSSDEIQEDSNVQENFLESEYLPENQSGCKKQKLKKVKKKKEEVVSKKAREKEMLDIQSENQRLLRELSIKLPYRKAPKCSLDEFLRERRKQAVPLTLKPTHSEVESVLIPEVPKTSHEHVNNDCDFLAVNNLIDSVTELDSVDNALCEQTDVCIQREECLDAVVTKRKEDTGLDENDLNTEESVSHEVPFEQQNESEQDKEKPFVVEEENFTESKSGSVVCETVNSQTNECENTDRLVYGECSSTPPEDFISVKQKILDAAKSFTPRISVAPNQVIDLSDNCSDVKGSDFDHFVERFVSHTKEVNKKHGAQEVKLSIVSKDGRKDGEFQLSEIFVDVTKKEDLITEKPGLKLMKLKERLLEKIIKKKEEAAERRKELELMDNEIQPEEEEEAELTDESDVDDNAIDETAGATSDDDDDDDDEEEEIVSYVLKKKKASAFIDDEASEDNEDQKSCRSIKSPSSFFSDCDSNNRNLGLNLPKEKDGGEIVDEESRLLYCDSSSEDSSVNASGKSSGFEVLSSSAIPSYQPGGGFMHLKDKQANDGNQSEPEDIVKNQQSDVVENLYSVGSLSQSSQQLWTNDDPAFPPTWRNNSSEKQYTTPDMAGLIMNPLQSQSDNMDDLLALCSGRFTDSFKALSPINSDSEKEEETQLVNVSTSTQGQKNNFDTPSEDAFLRESREFSIHSPSSAVESPASNILLNFIKPQSVDIAKDLKFSNSPPNVDDALGLCSGTFSSRPLSVAEEPTDDLEQDSDADSDFDRMSTSSFLVTEKKQARVLSDSDADGDDVALVQEEDRLSVGSQFSVAHDDDDEDADPESIVQEDLESLRNGNKINKVSEYFEAEAELSGSDVGSDADDDGNEEDGYLEDLIHDEELYSEEDLRSQIGKVHLKKLLDEDKRELRLYQELYLEDGDLHSEGPRRERKFTWRNSGALDPVDGEEADSESDHEDAPEEEKWRLERHEREKWLREQEDNDDAREISPLKFQSRSSLKLEIVNKVLENPSLSVTQPSDSSGTSFLAASTTKARHGSLLARGQDYLSGLAKRLKKTEDNSAGSRTTKHFVFRAVSPKKEAAIASNSCDKTPKPCSSRTKVAHRTNFISKKRKSIFDYLD